MNTDVVAVVVAAAKANTALTGRVSNRIYFGEAPASAILPYVVFYSVADVPRRCFATGDDFEQVTLQASMWDLGPSVQAVDLIASDVCLALDRQTLTYTSRTHIGCIRVGGTGPDRVEEAWQRTLDFEITYK